MFSLGYIAYTREDFSEALSWFTRAAEMGHHRSKYWIGKMFWRGESIPQDRKRARSLFSEAASKKVIEAQRAVRFLSYLSRR
jgi:TPR repeat protein